MKTRGIAMSFREVKGEMPSLDNICIRYYISSAELTAEKLAQGAERTGLLRISFTGHSMLK